MMNGSPMVEQVNRMVGNILAWSGEIALPGIGSLFVEWRTARRVTNRTVIPPCRIVGFTSQMQGALLTDEIARVSQCDATQAQDIYDRWLVRVLQDDVLTIEGVGVLKFKNFTLDEAFDRLLNPQGHEPVRVRSRYSFDWTLWLGATVIVCVVAVGISIWVSDRSWLGSDEHKKPQFVVSEGVERINIAEQEDQATKDQLAAASESASVEAIVPATVAPTPAAKPAEVAAPAPTAKPAEVTAPAPAAKPAEVTAPAPAAKATYQDALATPDSPATLVAGRRYVILGVFSTADNARKAIKEAAKKSGLTTCSVYHFTGGKLMVSPFNSTIGSECVKFIGEHGQSFPGMWTYVAK